MCCRRGTGRHLHWPLWASEVGAVEPCPALKNQSGDADTSLDCYDRRRLWLGFDLGSRQEVVTAALLAAQELLSESKWTEQLQIVT